MSRLIIAYDKEFVADVYVYASRKENFSVGSFEILCNGEKFDSQIVKFPKNEDGLSSTYMATLQRAFVRSADFVGKYAIPVLDPDKKLLLGKNEKKRDGIKPMYAKFIFRFHIIDDRALNMAKCQGGIVLTTREEKWKNLFKMMCMGFAKAQPSYRNLRITVEYEFLKGTVEAVSEIAEYADRELNHIYHIYKEKHE